MLLQAAVYTTSPVPLMRAALAAVGAAAKMTRTTTKDAATITSTDTDTDTDKHRQTMEQGHQAPMKAEAMPLEPRLARQSVPSVMANLHKSLILSSKCNVTFLQTRLKTRTRRGRRVGLNKMRPMVTRGASLETFGCVNTDLKNTRQDAGI